MPIGMDPLEAGERVLNGVVNNDLFILSASGVQGRACRSGSTRSCCPRRRSRRRFRRRASTSRARVMRCGIYEREIEHRKQKRKSYRSV